MKILALELRAFGPFTRKTLDLSGGNQGLHIILGPNEAGKSSALRALKALLYGIPERTSDNFLHPNDQLRVGGCLALSNGFTLTFQRRKGRKHTLVTAGDEPLQDTALGPFLQGVSAELFEKLFGIDHAVLVSGGREILEYQGEVGQLLFSAGMGTGNLRRVLTELDKQAEEIFLPRGSRPILNVEISKYREAVTQIKELSLAVRDWEGYRQRFEEVTRRLHETDQELQRLKAERHRLQRLQRVLPNLAKRREIKHRLGAYPEVVLLAEDFTTRRLETLNKLHHLEESLAKARTRLEALQAEAAEIIVSQPVLDQAQGIEALHQRLGNYQKAQEERPRLEAKHAQLIDDVSRLLKGLRPELSLGQVEPLRPMLAKRRRIQDLGNRYLALQERLNQAQRKVRELDQSLSQAQHALEGLSPHTDLTELRRLVEAARRQGDLDQALAEAHAEVTALEEQCQLELEQLGLWSGRLEEIETLALPSLESIDRFEGELAALQEAMRRTQEERHRRQRELHEVQRQLQELRLGGEIPDEKTLLASRQRRDQGWQLVKRQWLKGEAIDEEARAYDAERSLPAAYEHSVMVADQVADWLRREAERVQKQASLLLRCDQLNQELANSDRCVATQRREWEQLQNEWRALWAVSAITPLSPREMRAWLTRQQRLCENLAHLRDRRRRLSLLEETRNAHLHALQHALEHLGGSLPLTGFRLEPVLSACEAMLARLEEANRTRDTLEREIARLQEELKQAQAVEWEVVAEQGRWSEEWRQGIRELGLGPEATPTEANEVLTELEQLFLKLDQASELAKHLTSLTEQTEQFQAAVQALVKQVAPDLRHLPEDQAVLQLNASLTRSSKEQARLASLQRQIREAKEESREVEATLQAVQVQLQTLCSQAGCKAAEELEQVEQKSTTVQTLQRELARLEEQLLIDGEGLSIEELERQSQVLDLDDLPARIQALTDRIERELEPQRNELYQSKGQIQSELARMDGSAQAAAVSEQAQQILASIRAQAERYVRLRLASRVLSQAIERYRTVHQEPLLRRAGEYFAQLTCGSFARLGTDFNDRDEPIVVGIRPQGSRIRVEAMSSGTRDQLYLALRLATLERYIESAEPLPFIVDDILINFDDVRSKATLEVLAELSAKTQIILFTHHAAIAEQAKHLNNQAEVWVHTLT